MPLIDYTAVAIEREEDGGTERRDETVSRTGSNWKLRATRQQTGPTDGCEIEVEDVQVKDARSKYRHDSVCCQDQGASASGPAFSGHYDGLLFFNAAA
jgi:hypothetical protein